ncbi:MAG: MoaD/ThiS family protein [Desulfuromonadales bacterium]|nr:MoaD/ThiS family protein [Desulfuromonadales bacterium]
MIVNVKLFASFRAGRFDMAARDFPPGSKVGDVASELQLAEKEIGTILVNSKYAKLHSPLREGDTLALFPLIGGG